MPSTHSAPDLVGYTLEEAREVLATSGWPEGGTVDTHPPRRTLSGPRRIVRQRADETGRIAFVVCGERSEDARV